MRVTPDPSLLLLLPLLLLLLLLCGEAGPCVGDGWWCSDGDMGKPIGWAMKSGAAAVLPVIRTLLRLEAIELYSST